MKLLTEEQKERILRSVQMAEKRTSGEIVPYIVRSSDFYFEAFLKSALFFNFFSLAIVLVIYELYQLGYINLWSEFYDYFNIQNIIFITFFMSIVGYIICYIPPVRRFFAGRDLIERRVKSRAYEAFLEREVFKTKNRTGVLLFISYLEHRVVVLGDTNINQHVSPNEWKEVVQMIIDGIKKGDIATGIENAIQKCGELLERSGLIIEKDDKNEISDEITEK